MLEASEFALVFALIDDLLAKECTDQLTFPGVARLPTAIRERNLDHDWYHVLDLSEFLTCEADYCAFEALIAAALRRIMNVGWEAGVPTAFYEGFPHAKFLAPHREGTHWRVVAWPLVQVAALLLQRGRTASSEALMGRLFCAPG